MNGSATRPAKRLLLGGDSLAGNDATAIGPAPKSYPADQLEPEVMRLADRHLLSANKRLVNLGLELMGARTIQRIGAEIDARGRAFRETIREHGVKHAFPQRDAAFRGGYASVRGRDPDYDPAAESGPVASCPFVSWRPCASHPRLLAQRALQVVDVRDIVARSMAFSPVVMAWTSPDKPGHDTATTTG